MAQVEIRDIDDGLFEALRRRAQRNSRSLDQELREILRAAVAPDRASFLGEARRIRKRTIGRPQTDSADLLREDRDR
ncbi:FitA-like ribbon-helix-helix domain-containing protein [Azospirillum sp. sgz302134]